MEDLIIRFPFVAQEIFEKLDNKSLTKCREVSKLWKDFIDERNYPWIRIVKIPTIQTGSGNTFLHLSAKTGQIEMFETLFSDLELVKNRKNEWRTISHFLTNLANTSHIYFVT